MGHSPSVLHRFSLSRTQEEHHKKRTFQEEYLEFLQRGGVEYDERFLW